MYKQANELILIVDDSPTNLAMLSYTLEKAGLKVQVAHDGESAIQKVLLTPPDIILLDIYMPGIDGFETCIRLKSHPDIEDIPIIFMTALTDIEDKVKGLSLGAVDYITKPCQEEELLARVRVHLKLSRLTKTLAENNLLLQQMTENLEQRVAERTKLLSQALRDLKAAQVQLVQKEKLATLGELVAGIAHEINNPVGFLINNLAPAKNHVADITKILNLYLEKFPNPGEEIESELETIDLKFALQDLPKIIESMHLGTEMIRNISISLRNFSRSDTTNKIKANIHAGIDSTLLILQHRLKNVGNKTNIKVVKKYGKLPEAACYPGQLNQVFMNIIANAIDAIEESLIKQNELPETELNTNPHIYISTELISNYWIVIRITDNGVGMTEEVKQHIFEPLFTTKPVGKGTGLGMSISRQIIEEKHGGSLKCSSHLGKGTEFKIIIPINNTVLSLTDK